jgi:hypothetical protein
MARRKPVEPPKVTARCGACRTSFRCEFRDAARPPGRCPLCHGLGTYWCLPDGQPLGPPPPEPAKPHRAKATLGEFVRRKAVYHVSQPRRPPRQDS